MGTATIEVPAGYAEDFRDAVLVEIRTDAERIAEAVDEEQRTIFTDRDKAEQARWRDEEPPEGRGYNGGDIVGSVGSVRDSYALLAPAVAEEASIEGDTATLMHTFETMADKILAPKLAQAVNVSPINAGQAEAITHLTDEIGWAVGESARLEALWQLEHAEKKRQAA